MIDPLTIETEGDGVRIGCLDGNVNGDASNSDETICGRSKEMVSIDPLQRGGPFEEAY